MHLELNQRLQEIASFKRDKFFPPELDLALNKAMFRLLEKGVENDFQGNEINLSHVSALIKKNKVSEVIIPKTTDPIYEENELSVYAMVPANYLWLVNGRAEVINNPYNCEEAPALPTTSFNESVTVVPFPASAGVGVPNYFSNVAVTSSVSGTLYSSPAEMTGFASQDSKYVVINNILEYFARTGTVNVYWERYRDTYYKNSFVFVSTVSLGTVYVIIYRNDRTTIDAQTSSTPVTTNYNVYNRALIGDLTQKAVANVPVKPLKQNQMYEALKQNSFYTTSLREVSLNETRDYFILYREESFLVTRMSYDYIRKPRTISLFLNQSCELADSTHHKVIDLAVEILRLDTKDESYEATVQNTELRAN